MNITTFKSNTPSTLLVHCIIWSFFVLTSLIQFYETPFRINADFYIQWITGICFFYLNYIYLVPTFLLRKKYWTYAAIIFGLIGTILIIRSQYYMPELSELGPHRVFNQQGNPRPNLGSPSRKPPFFLKIVPAFFYLLVISISALIRILSEFYINEQNKLIAETQRTSTELSYLRKQTNPHFLFNSLNSIYSLAHKKSDLVPDAIVTLSELMRYMLYETDNKFVLLEKEINYIQNYIELQKLRLNNIENIAINIHGETKNIHIEPLLLISFIENAFKYGTDYKGAAYVKIKITIIDTILDFYVENKIESSSKDPENSGIGLKNIESRLNMLYPNSHQLTITETDQKYIVSLKLNLEKIKTSSS